VLVALALLGIIAVAFLSGLSTALKAVKVSDMHSTAQSLATSQLEYAKSWDYNNVTSPPSPHNATYGKINLSEYPDYSIKGIDHIGTEVDDIIGVPFDPDTGNVCYPNDMGIQSVTIKVYHSDKLLFTLTDYKIDLQ
jgi:type II secretory pathway pseudopilin PulG